MQIANALWAFLRYAKKLNWELWSDLLLARRMCCYCYPTKMASQSTKELVSDLKDGVPMSRIAAVDGSIYSVDENLLTSSKRAMNQAMSRAMSYFDMSICSTYVSFFCPCSTKFTECSNGARVEPSSSSS
jgi:formiminotetrahydrofolate cyclodeaminase